MKHKLGAFSKAEQKKIISVIAADWPVEMQQQLLAHYARCAISAEQSNAYYYAAEQKRDHARARKIEKLAKRIMQEGNDDPYWRALVKPAEKLTSLAIRLKGRPHKYAMPAGALELACFFIGVGDFSTMDLMGAMLRADRKLRNIPRSSKSGFADVLRIVYRVRDPLPIIDEIRACLARRPPPSALRGIPEVTMQLELQRISAP